MGKGSMLLRLSPILTLLGVFVFYTAVRAQTAVEKTAVAVQEPGSDSRISTLQSAENPQSENTEKKRNEADDEGAKPAKRKTHFHLGAITVGASYTNFGHAFVGPFHPYYAYPFYPYYPYGAFSVGAFYTTYFSDPFYGPYAYYTPYAPGFGFAPEKGEVRLASLGRNKGASVYIDNAYAGSADKLKQMWLEPGAYDLSLQAADGSTFQRRIYVLSGKTLKIEPDFSVAKSSHNEEKK